MCERLLIANINRFEIKGISMEKEQIVAISIHSQTARLQFFLREMVQH